MLPSALSVEVAVDVDGFCGIRKLINASLFNYTFIGSPHLIPILIVLVESSCWRQTNIRRMLASTHRVEQAVGVHRIVAVYIAQLAFTQINQYLFNYARTPSMSAACWLSVRPATANIRRMLKSAIRLECWLTSVKLLRH